MTLLDELRNLLKKDKRLVSGDELLKNKIVELALKLDKDLIKLLLSSKRIKEHFFVDVDETLVFDKEKFMKFVDNKEFLPDSHTAFKNKIGLTADKRYISESKEVVLSWPYKDCILEGGQEKTDEKRKEIFHNEILAPDEIDRLLEPKVFTNFKRIDAKGEHKVKEIKPTDNLIIKGNNLLVLHSLKKRFAGKVKLIYIDPPYNTGNDEFKYNDNFNHSTWLTFMKNRLEVAKELLKYDGVIFISCDDNEQAYLKVLCDEIFDRENFIATIIKKSKIGGGSDTKYIVKEHEYLICYAKDINSLPEMFVKHEESYLKRYKENDKKGRFFWDTLSRRGLKNPIKYTVKAPDGTLITGDWIISRSTFEKWLKEGDIRFIKLQNGKWSIQFKQRLNIQGKKPRSLALHLGGTIEGKRDIKEILGDDKIFQYPKAVGLIKFLIEMINDKNAIILDFFAGSGTTAQAVLEQNKEDNGNRRVILCEQLDYVHSVTVSRIRKTIEKLGDGDFVYCELMELNEKFIRKIQAVRETKELLKIWDEMKKHALLSYKIEPKDIDKNIDEFKKLSFKDQKRFLIEILDKNDLYVNYSEIDDKQYNISEEDKKINRLFYKKEDLLI